jgi:hypothetical protein
MNLARSPVSIGQEVAVLIIRGRRDPRITWELGGIQVKVNSTVALAGVVGRGAINAKRRAFYAALERRLYGTGWTRSGPARYRQTG